MMKKEIIEVQEHYDANPLREWNRLQTEHPYEKYITTKVMERYIQPGDKIFDIGGVIYGLRQYQESILIPEEKKYFDIVLQNRATSLEAFTQSYMTTVADAKALFTEDGKWKIETVFSQEGVLAPYKYLLAKTPYKERMAWYEFGYQICENENYLTHGEHLMIVARKQNSR